MSTNTLQNGEYTDLGETWYCHQAARIVQRHIQFGQHCRLDLDTLLAGVARRIRRANLDSAAKERWHQLNRDSVDRSLLSQAGRDLSEALLDGAGIAGSTVQASRPQGAPECANRPIESKLEFDSKTRSACFIASRYIDVIEQRTTRADYEHDHEVQKFGYGNVG
jgi:hypothetical protein